MSQTRAMSALEAAANVTVGWMVALATQLVVFPVVGLQATIGQNLTLSGIFTGVSLLRSFFLRRVFERFGSGRRASRTNGSNGGQRWDARRSP